MTENTTFKAPYFEPGEPSKIDWWVVWMCIFIVGGFILLPIIDHYGGKILSEFSIAPLVLGFAMMIGNRWRYALLKGKLEGFVEINDEEIKLPGKVVSISSIESVEVETFDYYGGLEPEAIRKWRTKIYPYPLLSQGVENYFKIKTKGNEDITIYFKQENKDDRLKLIPFMAQMIVLDKIHYLKAISMLGLKYEEIKQLKEELGKYNYEIPNTATI